MIAVQEQFAIEVSVVNPEEICISQHDGDLSHGIVVRPKNIPDLIAALEEAAKACSQP